MPTLAQIKTARDKALAALNAEQARSVSDSLVQARAQTAKIATLTAAYNIAQGRYHAAAFDSKPITAKSRDQVWGELELLTKLRAAASPDGGSATRARVAPLIDKYIAYGGDVRTEKMAAELVRRGLWPEWIAAHPIQSTWSTFRPFVKFVVAGAAVVATGYALNYALTASSSVAASATPAVTGTAAPAGAVTAGGGAQVVAAAAPAAQAATYSGIVDGIVAKAVAIGEGAVASAVTAKVLQAVNPKKPAQPRPQPVTVEADPLPATSNPALPLALAGLLGAIFLL
jgi:hypothetical protein